MSITIKDVAKKTGVSITTVSQILNGKGQRFSEKTREKVWSAAEELNYKANYFAQNMVTKQTQTIGVIIPDITNTFYSDMIKGIEDYLYENGFMVLLCNSTDNEERENLYLNQLVHRSVDGFIIASSTISDEMIFDLLKKNDKPYILLDRKREEHESDNIIVDDTEGGYVATEHLITLGHRNIGVITSSSSDVNVHNRFVGYKKCMEDYGLLMKEEWIMRETLSMSGGYEAAKKLLQADVSAIFATSDQLAIGVYRAASEVGVCIPEQLSLIGYDDIELASYMSPPLTTIHQPIYEIGKLAAETLIHRIMNPEEAAKNHLVKTRLVVRSSTKVL
ncbi:ribose utilization transcriptional repressor RbsR [Priestia taiwanensis]|uniref:LacI family transcriptional regulator n=1 Tax=Priestia taiwanensis TaxID=1347902 RepID=A0A917AJ55_9BACI|nr:LacI family DNA-binding transcriptional regulator [Priestia taiwanensis]MBM7361809.1 LacI family transcriptional regulator [Priestia taiwanensis]GGE57142.1 LacI family transcriptional regulator [Priestia taiwanensis]